MNVFHSFSDGALFGISFPLGGACAEELAVDGLTGCVR